MEIWKDISGYEGLYKISIYGVVISLDRVIAQSNGVKMRYPSKILKLTIGSHGYLSCSLSKNCVWSTKTIHSLVAKTFIPNSEGKPEVNHKNGIKTDNNVNNLEWSTSSDNRIHAYQNGLKFGQKGINNAQSKLNEKDVFNIKYGHDGLLQKEIAKIYGISKVNVSMIRTGKTWTHV